jgi:3-hydroxyacyl-[acyl-carrier-protein] dehydratase
MNGETIFDINQIIEILPHRYPFLMLDRIIEFEDNKRIVGIKNVTMNEPYFPGHFPGRPVMPGVMMIEAMAQVAAILAHKSSDGVKPGYKVFLVGADEVKWKRLVQPGDTLRIEMTSVKKRRPLWIMSGVATVNGETACLAKLSAIESQ